MCTFSLVMAMFGFQIQALNFPNNCRRVSKAAVFLRRNLRLTHPLNVEIYSCEGLSCCRLTLLPRPRFQCRSVVHLLEELTFWLLPCIPLCKEGFERGWRDLQLGCSRGRSWISRRICSDGALEEPTVRAMRNTPFSVVKSLCTSLVLKSPPL